MCFLANKFHRESSFCNENAASIFGEQKRLEPMTGEQKVRWRKEINWLLSVTDHIVEFVPSQQTSHNGVEMEVGLSIASMSNTMFLNCIP